MPHLLSRLTALEGKGAEWVVERENVQVSSACQDQVSPAPTERILQ